MWLSELLDFSFPVLNTRKTFIITTRVAQQNLCCGGHECCTYEAELNDEVISLPGELDTER